MTSNTLDIPALAAEFTAVHPTWQPRQQRIALALFRLLAGGAPVTVEAAADRAELPLTEVAAFVAKLPMLYRDEQGRIIAFGGLTL